MTRFYHSSKLHFRFISVFHNPFVFFRLTLFTLMLFFISSCEEDPTKIGSGLLPENDFVAIFGTDTLSVKSYTMYDDSVRTDNPAVSYLGQIYDPYFGTTTAEFVTQIRLGSVWDDKPFIIDSIKLFLHLVDVRGGTDVAHTLRISEIGEQLFTGSAYYSNKPVLKADPVNDILYKNDFDLNLPVLKADTVNDIVLNLPVEFGNYLTRDTAQLFYSNTKPDFRSFFKGLYFQMYSSADPLMIALSVAPPSSLGAYNNYIVFFMTNEVGVAKQQFFVLDAINKNAAFNKFSHDYSTALPGKKIQHINDNYRDTLSYLQYLNGVYTKIALPGLASLKNDLSFDKIAVNKSKLSIPVFFDGDIYKTTTVPTRLILRYMTASGGKYVVPDFSIGYSSDYGYSPFFDGALDTIAKAYNFNIPAFVQGYLNDSTGIVKPELEIFQQSGTRNVILKANKSKNPIKFEFTYTKF